MRNSRAAIALSLLCFPDTRLRASPTHVMIRAALT